MEIAIRVDSVPAKRLKRRMCWDGMVPPASAAGGRGEAGSSVWDSACAVQCGMLWAQHCGRAVPTLVMNRAGKQLEKLKCGQKHCRSHSASLQLEQQYF